MEPNRMFTAFDDAFPYTRHTHTHLVWSKGLNVFMGYYRLG